MKSLYHYLLVTISILFFSNCAGNSQPVNTDIQNTTDRIEVLDFHTDHRCKTCLNIEKLTKTILTSTYAEELEKGTITFQLINVDKKENFKLAQKFGAFGTTLVINVVLKGEEKFIDLTDFAFMNVDDEIKFTQGIKDHLEKELKRF